MPQAMAFVPLIMAAVSAATSVIGGIMQSKQLDVQAKQAKAEGAEMARRQRQKNAALTGEQLVKLGGSGVETLGSPGDIVAQDAARGELAARDIEQKAAGQAYTYSQQARAKRIGAYSSIIGGGLEIVGGAYEKSQTGSTSSPAFGGGMSNDFGLGGSKSSGSSGGTNWDTAAMSKRFSLVPGGASSGYGLS